jgi:hypothetical protein
MQTETRIDDSLSFVDSKQRGRSGSNLGEDLLEKRGVTADQMLKAITLK